MVHLAISHPPDSSPTITTGRSARFRKNGTTTWSVQPGATSPGVGLEQHFTRRKVELGTYARPYGASAGTAHLNGAAVGSRMRSWPTGKVARCPVTVAPTRHRDIVMSR